MENHSEKFEKMLKDLPKYKVSKGKDAKILQALKSSKTGHFNFLTIFNMATFRKLTASALVLLVAVVVGLYSYGQVSYSYHLGQAEDALEELEVAAEAGDDEALEELAEEVLEELDAAAEIVEGDDEDVEVNAEVKVNEKSQKRLEEVKVARENALATITRVMEKERKGESQEALERVRARLETKVMEGNKGEEGNKEMSKEMKHVDDSE